MSAPTVTAGHDSYVAALPASQMFVDGSYQRPLDESRAKYMAHHWQPRLLGVLDVADRGEGVDPRYAIVNGQHRWAAARLRDPQTPMVVNVHTGLDAAGEARLFFDIDKRTKALTNWDRWHARLGAGDRKVTEIERLVGQVGLSITQSPGEKNIQCCTTLEKIWDRSGGEVLGDTLILILDVWPGIQDAVKATIVDAVALMLDHYSPDLNTGRLADAMSEFVPKQLHARAKSLQDQGTPGSVPVLVSDVLRERYNRSTGPKLKNIREVIAAQKARA